MQARDLKYLTSYAIPFLAIVSFFLGGMWSFATVIFAFVFIPLIDLILPVNNSNLSEQEEESKTKNKIFDYLLYLNVPLQYGILGLFLYTISFETLQTYELIGFITTMGICCGVLGINVAHELGHRVNEFEQTLAKSLLLTSLYMHFFVEHNRGHHKNVATPLDSATAKKNQNIYSFFIQTIIGSYLSAWKIQLELLKKEEKPFFNFNNSMLNYHIIQIGFVFLITYIFGINTALAFTASAFIGILLLETINYIEHYGLTRKLNERGVFEKVDVIHSWNADQTFGRIMLYELTRHSDHHYKASRKYQILRNLERSPQLPTGYPGMMLVSFLPPLFFRLMNKRINQINS
jgi:alkane 1-monooxygenase